MNGSMGRIRKIENNHITATLDATLHELKPSDAAFLTLAYAISVHKAQGSQWKRVIIPVFQSSNPNFQSRFLDRSLIYTALTRAAEQVIFLGDWEALQKAIERPPAAERREVGFPTWFKLAKEFERCRTGKG